MTVAVVASVGLGVSIVSFGPVLSLVVPALLSVMVLFVLVRALTERGDLVEQGHLLRWTLASFGLHLILGLAVALSAKATYYLGRDAGSYHGNALAILAHWQDGVPMPALPAGREGFQYMLAVVDWVFGPYRWAGIAINAMLSAALVPIVSDTARRLFGRKAARMVAPIVVLLPGMLIWGSQLLKEAPVWFFLAVAANCGVRLMEGVTVGPLVLLTSSLSALFTFRGFVGVAVLVGIVGGITISKQDLAGGVTTALMVAGIVALALSFGLGSSGFDATVNSDLKQVDYVRQGLSERAGSGFDASADVSTTGGAISYLPRGLVGLLAGPFPWKLKASQVVAIPDVLAWYFLFPSLWRGARAATRISGRRLFVLVMPAFAIAIMLALVIGNYGTIIRERMQILVLVAPIIALGLTQRVNRAKVEYPVAATGTA